jgi:hypothetical protein
MILYLFMCTQRCDRRDGEELLLEDRSILSVAPAMLAAAMASWVGFNKIGWEHLVVWNSPVPPAWMPCAGRRGNRSRAGTPPAITSRLWDRIQRPKLPRGLTDVGSNTCKLWYSWFLIDGTFCLSLRKSHADNSWFIVSLGVHVPRVHIVYCYC